MKLLIQRNHLLVSIVFFFIMFAPTFIKTIPSIQSDPKTDLIIYSYDRPLQLYALLESIEKYITGLRDIFVIIRSSSQAFKDAYTLVHASFPHVQIKEQAAPYDDLKELTLQCLTTNTTEYIIFGVDDIIVKDFINLTDCAHILNTTDAYGFFFRLGKNLNYCYAMNCSQELPPFTNISENIYTWQFSKGEYDWKYPNNLDFTMYRKSEIVEMVSNSNFSTPYSLESHFMSSADYEKNGICFTSSKIVNFPLNIVQTDWPNASINKYDTKTLLDFFSKGLKIDVTSLHQFENKSAHCGEDTLITFIPRSNKLIEKPIVIVIPSYNNIEWWEWNLTSSLHQNYHNYYIMITDDCSTDGTGTAIENYIQTNQLSHKVKLIKNKERRGALHNFYTMIHNCSPETIIVTVDGDDALYDPEVLNRLNQIYSTQDVWLTYGQFIEHPSGTKGWCTPIPEHIIKNNAFRDHPHLPSHLRTFYAGLFQSIKLEDLMYNGEFYTMSWDYAAMLPMIEMAGERHMCLQDQIMYIYNNANAISDHKISRQLQAHLAQIIRAKSRYKRLAHLESAQDFNNEHADFSIFAEDALPQTIDIFLTSVKEKIIGIGQLYILYRHNPERIQEYMSLKKKHHDISFFEIDQKGKNFKEILTTIYHYLLRNNYIVFSLVNAKIEHPINLHHCIQVLEETRAFGFSLQLSKINSVAAIPERLALNEIRDDVCAWNYAYAYGIWACANSIDLTLYRHKNDTISGILNDYWAYIYCPAHFLGWWSNEGNLDKVGLCFKYPKVSKICS